MDSDNKELIEKILKVFNKKGYQVKKIFYNEPTNEAIIIAPVNDMDGIFVYTSKSNKPIPFVPSEDFKLYDKIVKDENLIYDHTELDDIVHSTEYGKGFYQKIEKYYPDGRTRYFYSPQEWAAYQENKGQDEFRKKQAQKKTIGQKSDMTGYDKWKKEQEEIKKEEARLKSLHETQERLKKEREENTKKILDDLAEKLEKEKKAEERKKFAEYTIARRDAEIKDNLDRERARIKEEQRLQAEAEELSKNLVKYYRKQNEELLQNNGEYMMMDADSALNKASDIIEKMNDPAYLANLLLEGESVFISEIFGQDKKIDEIYSQIKQWKEIEETDPTNGLKIKNYDLPIEEEIKLVNPGFYYSDESNMLGGLLGYPNDCFDHSMNCYACTTAMALRMKGYDVTAGKDYDGMSVEYQIVNGKVDYMNPSYNYKETASKKEDTTPGTSYNDLWTGKFTKTDYFENTLKQLKNEPAGSYGDFNMTLITGYGTDRKFGSGDEDMFMHSIFYQIDTDGDVHFYDCQAGIEISEEKMRDYASLSILDNKNKQAYYTAYKRLDNQEFKGYEKMTKYGRVSNLNVGGLL